MSDLPPVEAALAVDATLNPKTMLTMYVHTPGRVALVFRLLLVGLLAAAALSARPAPLHAQEPTAADMQRAREHFDQGAVFYTQGEYGKAIVEFLKGNELSPNAMFLYNISLCYEHLGNLRQAYAAAERAMALPGMAPGVVVRNQARMQAFRLQLTGADVADGIGAAGGPQVVAGPQGPVADDGPLLGAAGWTGTAIAVAGVALIGGAAYMNSTIQEPLGAYKLAGATSDSANYYRLQSEIRESQSTGRMLLYGGIGMTTAGALLLIYDLVSDDAPAAKRSRLFTGPTPGGAMVGIDMTF